MSQRLIILFLFIASAGLVYRTFHYSQPINESKPLFTKTTLAVPDTYANEPVVAYIWKITDFYDRIGPEEYRLRESPPATVKVGQPLAWRASHGLRTHIQVAARADFSGPRQHFESGANLFEFNSAYLGANFWRASHDGQTWSMAKSFRVEARFNERPAVARAGLHHTLELNDDNQTILVECSSDPEFAPSMTEVKALKPHQRLLRVGANFKFARIRRVNAQGELGRATVLALRR